ncbi:hypothetical protein [Actinomycetospora termitidis]|uniref:Integral membrane protein n=1 Tax=Actinomycetospora termitidis TaxID=3053470 RepID=A0ABT7M5Q4_9PSEU|nr:hypothetical protein [Actinomycetospora sp. Odt1-22]MDL5155992.1 hypothetical protein [Actinomycetospora sp. Odt1-22]
MSYPNPGFRPGDPYRGGGPSRRGPAGPSRGSFGPPPGSSRGRPPSSGRAPGGRSVRLDPVLAESLIGVAWLTVGTLGIGADGAGTLLLAVGIAVVVVILVENRRRGSHPFDGARSSDLLRFAGIAVGAIIVESVLLGLISWSEAAPGVAAVITGAAFLALSRSTGQRPTQWLGVALAVLGVLAAVIATQEASGFVSQGLLGLVCGVLVLLSAADRIGLLESLRDRVR